MTKVLINSGPSARGWHRVESFLRCGQLYALKYVGKRLQRDGTAAEPLVRGSIGHVGLAHHYARLQAVQRKQDPERFWSPQEAMARVAPLFGQLGLELLPIARMTVLEYISRYADEDSTRKILHVEEQFSVELRDGRPPRHLAVADPAGPGRITPFTMRPDLIFEDSSKRGWIWDHKLVTVTKASTSQRYINSGQFLALRMLGRALFGEKFGGVVVNVLQCFPNTRFQRSPVDPAPGLQARFPSIILDAEERIAQLMDEGRAVDEWPATASEQTCYTAYGPCPAHELCRWGITDSVDSESTD